ncbi:MAG TPA: HYR domain-containing protein [Woeseiaceae bacterium]
MPGDPGRNVNLIGPTPDPGDIRDSGLKQQNEPACAVRPENPACVICAYNDYRTVEKPADDLGNPIIGDAWQGVSTSCDVGTGDVWRSRVAPGHAADDPEFRIPGRFAADPRLVALPGMALFNFITGFRDDNRGALVVQHWLEVNREDADPYEPAARSSIVDLGTDGRFIDKPDMLALLDPVSSQVSVPMMFDMENEELGTIPRDFPSGDLLFAYAVFTGSNSVKVLVKSCDDWGRSCPNQATKLSEDQNLVSGISLSAIGDTVMAVWRRRGDNNEPDAIMWAVSNNRGKKWTKAEEVPLCSFDMASFTSGDYVTFRTNDFPWIANDGERFYLFYSDRSFDESLSCETGRPRIVMRYAEPGGNIGWSNAQALDNGIAAAQGLQFMPTAFGARGKVQVAWYDTRREILPDLSGPDDPKALYRDQFVADYPEFISGRAVVNRKLDVYTARVEWDEDAGAPAVSVAERVSQYRLAAESEAGEISVPAIEGEAFFGNIKAYDSGKKSFVGDYIAMAAPEFRKVFAADGTWTGSWENNASPLAEEPNDVDFFVAWTDQRDMRGEILPEMLDLNTPFETATVGESVRLDDSKNETTEAAGVESLVAFGSPADPPRDMSKTTEGLAGTEDFADTCTPGDLNAQDRTRDANIYGSLIRDRLRLYAPTPTKPLLGLQRTFPVGLTNRNTTERKYRLIIVNQPCDEEKICRASWRQKPSGPLFLPMDDPNYEAPDIDEDLTVPPNSTLARTLFMVGASEDDQVRVDVYDADLCDSGSMECKVLASITLGGTNSGSSGPLQQPEYDDSPICSDIEDPAEQATCFSNLENELHNPELLNPELANPELANPELANPELANPELLNPELLNPELLNPELLNPELANLGFENPELANPELANPELLNPELANPELANPELLNPELANPELANPELANSSLDDGITWTDYTYAVKNTGNVTTAFNADMELSGPAAANVDSQLIAHTIHFVPTSRDCNYVPQLESQVLATVNSPDDDLDIADIQHPFDGGISALAAPGQTIFFTRRIFGTPAELANVTVSGFTASSQAANCRETSLDGTQSNDYVCESNLISDQELILLDTAPPTFDNIPTGIFEIAADDADGVCTDLTAALGITATDNGEAVAVSCQVSEPPDLCAVAPALDEQVPLGPSTATCTAVDFAVPPNEATITIAVVVTDQTAPTLASLSASIDVDLAPTEGSTSVDFEANVVASDNVSAALEIDVTCETSDDPPFTSGDALRPGTYSVGCTATDPAGNGSIVENLFTVTINDVTAPQITVPADFTRPALDANGAVVTFAVTASDKADPAPSLSCTPASGALFPLGPTTVNCKATDASTNQSEASFIVTVADLTAPVFTIVPPAAVGLTAGADGTATLDLENVVTATDNVDSVPLVSCLTDTGLVTGDALSVGTHVVTCSATDSAGNSTSDTDPPSDAVYTVIVEDASAPVIFAPSDFTAAAADATGAVVSYSVTVTDNADPTPSLACVPSSGSLFPLGATTVTCTATDDSANSSAATFVVTVTDQTAPVFTTVPAAAVTVEAGADGTATLDFEAQVVATDNVDTDPLVSCQTNTGLGSGSLLPVGSYTVTCSASDSAGNSTSDSGASGDVSFTVIVADVSAPAITVPDDFSVQADDVSGATVNYSVTVIDNADTAPSLVCSPASGTLFAFGATTVTCDAEDASGNTASASFVVTVEYGSAYGIEFSKGLVNPGSTVPLVFGWRNAARDLMDSSGADPVVTAKDESGKIVLNPGEFPGNSDLRWDAAGNIWKFNWQTVCSATSGDDCPEGAPLPAGTYYLQVTSRATGQTIPEKGFDTITIKD